MRLVMRRTSGGWRVTFSARALASCIKLAAGTTDLADTLYQLGLLLYSQPDMAAARKAHERARVIQEKLVPGSSALGNTLYTLGLEANSLQDLSSAEDAFRSALAIRTKPA